MKRNYLYKTKKYGVIKCIVKIFYNFNLEKGNKVYPKSNWAIIGYYSGQSDVINCLNIFYNEDSLFFYLQSGFGNNKNKKPYYGTEFDFENNIL